MNVFKNPLEGVPNDLIEMSGLGFPYPRLFRPQIDTIPNSVKITAAPIDRTGLPSDELPRDRDELTEYRLEMHQRCLDDIAYRREVYQKCKEDILYFVNAMGWVQEPRAKTAVGKELVLCTFALQEQMMMEFRDGFYTPGRVSIVAEKSRGVSLTWSLLYVYFWRWLFYENEQLMVVSRKEDLVDKPGEMDPLFQKLEYIYDHLPKWMRPRLRKIDRKKMLMRNPNNGSYIKGEASVSNIARGGRLTSIFIDEAAHFPNLRAALGSISEAVYYKIIGGTPDERGESNVMYNVLCNPAWRRISAHWPLHPIICKGMYRGDKDGGLRFFDPEYDYDKDYPYIFDGKLRSPYYDAAEAESTDTNYMAREFDMNWSGSKRSFFHTESIVWARDEFSREPDHVVDIEFDHLTGEPVQFHKNPHGIIRLWCDLDPYGVPVAAGRLAAGADISAGTGASNSVLSVGIAESRAKILECVSAHMPPHVFAGMSVAILRLLSMSPEVEGEPLLIWELQGPGRNYGNSVLELGYSHVFYPASTTRGTVIPGWPSTTDAKRELLGALNRAYIERMFQNPSREAIEECFDIVYITDKKIDHVGGHHMDDPSGARDNHGDRATADALLWKGLDLIASEVAMDVPEQKVGSPSWRVQQALREDEEADIALYGV